jgi:hypothetical protein
MNREYVPSSQLAMVYTGLGKKDEAPRGSARPTKGVMAGSPTCRSTFLGQLEVRPALPRN